MVSRPDGVGDLSRHLLISRSISIRIKNLPEKDDTRPTKKRKLLRRLRKHLPWHRGRPLPSDKVEEVPLPVSVKVFFNDHDVTGQLQPEIGKKESGGVTHHFALACDIPMFPNFDDKLKFQLSIDKAAPNDFTLGYTEIAQELEVVTKKAAQARTEVQAKEAEKAMVEAQANANADRNDENAGPPKPTEDIATKSEAERVKKAAEAKVEAQAKDKADQNDKNKSALKPTGITITLPNITVDVILHVAHGSIGGADPSELDPVAFISAIDSEKMRAEALTIEFVENRIVGDFVKLVDRVADAVAGFHPYAKVALAALSIPYKLMKNEGIFNANIMDLIDAILTTCHCLSDALYHLEVESAKEAFRSIIKVLRNAAMFVDIYLGKHRLGQILEAQLQSHRLEDLTNDLIKMRNNFQMTVIIQTARDASGIKTMTVDDYLNRHLKPVEEQRLRESCLANTRVNILETVQSWLASKKGGPKENILWIFGPPGVGKSTIATTIANDPKIPCAIFFCKRDDPLLRDPYQIWRTLAYRLSVADKRGDLQFAFMRAVHETGGKLNGFKAKQQLEKLIKEPLETVAKETKNEAPYPVIIIDALDELHIEGDNDDDWDSLLKSLESWSEISANIKLIVTSRDLSGIRSTLGSACISVDLTTKANVEDSKNDVEKFFKVHFKEMHEDFVSANWPIEAAIPEMVDYAAGLFIWAKMVVNFVKGRGAGVAPSDRLVSVHDDMSYVRTPDGNDVDRLYARILLEAFLRCNGDERKRGKTCLSAIVLAKEPLGMNDIIELFSTEQSYASAYVASTLEALSPIISTDEYDKLRVCHKTVSDFLCSHDRSEEAMKIVVEQWNEKMPTKKVPVSELNTFLLDCAEENGHVSLAYLRLVLRGKIPKKLSNLLNFARYHWESSRKDGGDVSASKILVDAIDCAFGRLDRFAQQLVFPNDEAQVLITTLRDAIGFVNQYCINNVADRLVLEDFRRRLERHTTNLDSARGSFQIRMVVNLTSVTDRSEVTIAADEFLKERLQPSDQRSLDEKCLPGTRSHILNEANNWLNSDDPKISNLLWIFGAPGAGKSAIAATLIDDLKTRNARLCGKVVVKRDFADRRDPLCIWRTLAYDLACSERAGLKGSIMEALLDVNHSDRRKCPSEDQHQLIELITKTVQEQQLLSVVLVVDALDECFAEDNNEWRALLQTLSGWTKLPHSFKLVVTSRDIPSIRATLENVSVPIYLATGSDTSAETKSDIGKFLRTQLPVSIDEEAVQLLTENAAGSFIWAKMITASLRLVSVDRLQSILRGEERLEGIDVVYANILLETSQRLQKEWEGSRTILATIVLARDPLTKEDIVELIAQNGSNNSVPVDKAIKELGPIISVDSDDKVRIPHKSFCDFLCDQTRSQKAIAQAVEQWKKTENSAVDPSTIVIDCAEESRCLALACVCIIRDWIPREHVASANLFKQSSRTFNYARRFLVEHLEGTLSLSGLKSLVITMEVVFNCLEQYAEDGGFKRKAAAPLVECLRVAASFAIQCINDRKCLPQEQIACAEDLIRKKNDFQITMIMRNARKHSDELQVPMTPDDFLRDRLQPTEGQPIERLEGCLEGTRVSILSRAREWLRDYEAKKNILWIVGSPGTGKSTIATAISDELVGKGLDCVKIFCKRDTPDLQDPRQILQTLAYSLASKHTGLKAAIMQVLDKGGSIPKDKSLAIVGLFEMFVKGPFETDTKEMSFRTNILYPVIVIDALDECSLSDEWEALLDVFLIWARMSGGGMRKLIITSRDLPKIRTVLSDISIEVGVATGESDLDDAKEDVKMYFAAKFKGMQSRDSRLMLQLPSNWPGDDVIAELTNYAAGLFVWADMVVKYIGEDAPNVDPVKRLNDVISVIRNPKSNLDAEAVKGLRRVDRIYAQAQFEAILYGLFPEAKTCLAAIVLAREPLRKDDLIELLSLESSSSYFSFDTLMTFCPTISTSKADGKIRVFHRTVSDFMLSFGRSFEAMRFIVEQWNAKMEPWSLFRRLNIRTTIPHSYILYCEEESGHLALACLRLIYRTCTKDTHNIADFLQRSDGAFFYARHYWFAHFKDAGLGMELKPILEGLADEMDAAFSSLDQFALHSKLTNNEAEAAIKCLKDAAILAHRHINLKKEHRKKIDSTNRSLETAWSWRQEELEWDALVAPSTNPHSPSGNGSSE